MQDINYLLSNKETAHAQTCQITTLKRIHILEQFLYISILFPFFLITSKQEQKEYQIPFSPLELLKLILSEHLCFLWSPRNEYNADTDA
jgi:hypothetical protein